MGWGEVTNVHSKQKRETGKPSKFVEMATLLMPFYCFFVAPWGPGPQGEKGYTVEVRSKWTSTALNAKPFNHKIRSIEWLGSRLNKLRWCSLHERITTGVPAFAHELITGFFLFFGGSFLEIRTPRGGYRRQIPDFRKPIFRFLFCLEIFPKKYVGEISKNK